MARRTELESQLDVPPLERANWRIWSVYFRIRRRTGSNGFGVVPVSWSELGAFVGLSKISLTPFEVEMLEMLDDLFVTEMSKTSKAKETTQ